MLETGQTSGSNRWQADGAQDRCVRYGKRHENGFEMGQVAPNERVIPDGEERNRFFAGNAPTLAHDVVYGAIFVLDGNPGSPRGCKVRMEEKDNRPWWLESALQYSRTPEFRRRKLL
jgi:hypothetical protein